MLRNTLYAFIVLTFFNCKEEKEKIVSESAKDIIDTAIDVTGGEAIKHSEISFDFREILYTAQRTNGKFKLERQFKDSISEIHDVLDNAGFRRYRDQVEVKLSDSINALYSASVNSVHYFSILPYGLDGDAVQKNYLGSEEVNGKDYHKIKITFAEDGGGEDFEDEFIYWIDKISYKVDFMAYSYAEDDGTGFRFREAYNERMVNTIRFVDYNNYKPTVTDFKIEDLGLMFQKGDLELLSKIELKNVTVKSLN